MYHALALGELGAACIFSTDPANGPSQANGPMMFNEAL